MFFIAIFIVSGIVIVLMLLGKRLEEKTRRPFFLLGWISQGDARARELSHRSAHIYSEIKEKGVFLAQKQLPMHTKSALNKFRSRVDDKINYLSNELRNSKLLKKNEGISEFLKNIAEVEKGNGEINDSLVDSQESSGEIK